MGEQGKPPEAGDLGGEYGIGGGGPSCRHSSTAGRQVQSLVFTASGRRVGSVVGGVLRETRHGKTQRLRWPVPAWSFDVATIEQAEALGAHTIEVKDADDGGRTYRVGVARFLAQAQRIDRGHGAQLALALSCWVVGDPEPDGPVQLTLFEVARP